MFKEGCWKYLPSAFREASRLANTFITRRNCGDEIEGTAVEIVMVKLKALQPDYFVPGRL